MPGVCPRCLREVYFAEEKLALGKVWHTFCFSCRNCRKLLDSWTVETHDGELFCRNCYNRNFSTTSVKPSLLLPINSILSPVDNKAHALTSSGLSADCCCCHYAETCLIIDSTNETPETISDASHCSTEKHRLRGGGGNAEEQKNVVEESPRRTFGQPWRKNLSRRVTFLSTGNVPSGCLPAYRSAMKKKVVHGTRTVISSENSDVCVESDEGNDDSDSATTKSQTGSNQDPDSIDGCNEEIRIRGGCGGGCGCGGGSNRCPEQQRQSHCGARYQSERISTIESACGCSGGRGSSSSRSGCDTGNRETGIGITSNTHKTGGCCGSGRDDENGYEGTCATKYSCSYRRPDSYESCPPRSPDSCASDSRAATCSAAACSLPCSDRKGCCPPLGCKPVRRRIPRCNGSCTGDSQGCGGGGCCGSGCRGGCGKPGQTCLPSRPCTIPPCQPHPGAGGSPCAPPRNSPPRPPCCRSPVVPGNSRSTGTGGFGGSSCCRSKSPGTRFGGSGGCSNATGCLQQDESGNCHQPRVPAGCECLGGGQDCQRCGRKVYHAEMQVVSGAPYHNICFSCFCCRKPLETLTYHENCGEIYCKQCYVRNFGPQGYGYAGVLQTPM